LRSPVPQCRRDQREVVARADIGVIGVAVVVVGLGGLRLILSDAIKVDDAIAEMDVISRKADSALTFREPVLRIGPTLATWPPGAPSVHCLLVVSCLEGYRAFYCGLCGNSTLFGIVLSHNGRFPLKEDIGLRDYGDFVQCLSDGSEACRGRSHQSHLTSLSSADCNVSADCSSAMYTKPEASQRRTKCQLNRTSQSAALMDAPASRAPVAVERALAGAENHARASTVPAHRAVIALSNRYSVESGSVVSTCSRSSV
jgi:hypothetical protein